MDYLDLASPWTWLIGGVILMALELAAPGFFLIWLGLAAVLVGGGNFLQPLPWEANGLLFATLAVALVFVGKRMTRRDGDDEATVKHLNQRANALVGRVTTLDQPIVAGEGKVRFDDAIWLATGPDLPAGARVKVIGAAGKVLQVASRE
ncbi:MAG: NfeD family protein [Hyphomicrobiales bacterium]|nr:NfeD family protein [Hyphomicrobiales bacterium]MBV9052926.1 NfeD family protein [Hyphomicrobiales bacterium]MBV9588402.1 NfeD family protein [Hyphomicrobiales bacterium]MBV9976833.1 NfeD family protein [Hyphomicrobiales bacterium]